MKTASTDVNLESAEVSSVTPPPLHDISDDPRIKAYLHGVDARLCRGNVLLQCGQFANTEEHADHSWAPRIKL